MWQHQADPCLLQSMMRLMITMAKSDRNNQWGRRLAKDAVLIAERRPDLSSSATVAFKCFCAIHVPRLDNHVCSWFLPKQNNQHLQIRFWQQSASEVRAFISIYPVDCLKEIQLIVGSFGNLHVTSHDEVKHSAMCSDCCFTRGKSCSSQCWQ